MTTEQVMEVMKEAMMVAFEIAGPLDRERGCPYSLPSGFCQARGDDIPQSGIRQAERSHADQGRSCTGADSFACPGPECGRSFRIVGL